MGWILITENNWWSGLPEPVQDFVKTKGLSYERMSEEDSDWRCAYTLDTTSDREVAGACVFGPSSSGIFIEASAPNITSLMICVASAVKELSSTTVPVLTTDEVVQDCLTACGINSQLYRKIDDGLLRIDSGHDRPNEE